jgi:hypothetical protein
LQFIGNLCIIRGRSGKRDFVEWSGFFQVVQKDCAGNKKSESVLVPEGLGICPRRTPAIFVGFLLSGQGRIGGQKHGAHEMGGRMGAPVNGSGF